MKRARVYPSGEGVPYYMLRELAVLQVSRIDKCQFDSSGGWTDSSLNC